MTGNQMLTYTDDLNINVLPRGEIEIAHLYR